MQNPTSVDDRDAIIAKATNCGCNDDDRATGFLKADEKLKDDQPLIDDSFFN